MVSSSRVVISYRTLSVLFSGCLMVFLSSGSFKASGVLFDDAVLLFDTSNLYGGWAFSLQFSIAYIVAGVGGAIFENSSYRVMGVTGGIFYGIGLTCLGVFGRRLWQLFLFNGITACGTGLLFYASFLTFLDHFEGRFAIYYSVRELFTFIGVTTIPVLVDALRSNYGFNGSYLILGGISFNAVVCGILMVPVSKNSPIKAENTPTIALREIQSKFKFVAIIFGIIGSLKRRRNPLNFSPVLRHPPFALIIFIHGMFHYNFVVWAIFLVSFGKSIGLSPDAAVLLSTAGGVGGFIGKLAVFVPLYCKSMNIMTSSIVPAVTSFIGLIGYLLSSNYEVLLMSSASFGFCCAYSDTAISCLMPNYICKKHVKQGLALGYLQTGIFMQLGSVISGAILDLTASFYVIFGTMACLNIFTCILATILFVVDKPVSECSVQT